MFRLFLALTLLFGFVPLNSSFAEDAPEMTVWKTPSCGCCAEWAKHMEANGFKLTVHETEDLGRIKSDAGVPESLQACHTAEVGGYVIEGHVPADDVLRLLAERPDARGLSVPGMPSGSPGMENGQHDPYHVILFDHDDHFESFNYYD